MYFTAEHTHADGAEFYNKLKVSKLPGADLVTINISDLCTTTW